MPNRMPHLLATLFLAALARRPLEEWELAALARIPYWLRWERC